MSNILVVCYSYTGLSRQLAQILCGLQSWTGAEVFDKDPRSGLSGLWRCLLDSILHRRPAIRYVGPNLRDYETVVLVSPIWAYRLASPMRSFIVENREQLKNVAVMSTMGSRGAPNAVAEIGQLLGRSPLMSTAFTSREIEDGSCAARLQAFGKAIQATQDSTSVIRPANWSAKEA